MISKPHPIDKSNHVVNDPELKAFYGLPENVIFCKKCTYSNQKPNSEKESKHTSETKKPTVAFDDEGVCFACRIAEEKEQVNWDDRRKELEELCAKYRRNDGQYDVLVPGSGGKDSFYASWVLKHEFGMNPLTVTWAPHIYTDWGWKNFESWTDAGFDNYLFTPNGKIHRLLTRLALDRLLHPFQPFMFGQMHFPPKLAAKLGISLVFYGENPVEYGNSTKGKSQGIKDWDHISSEAIDDIYLAGTSVAELKDEFGVKAVDLESYMPPTAELQSEYRLDIRYLGYYLKWHPQNCYYSAVENSNFRAAPERNVGSYSKYSSIDDKIDDFHYYTTFIKFGIGRATYDTAQEIRNGDITREEGLSLVKQYDGEYPSRFEDDFFKYVSLPKSDFPVASKQFEQSIVDREYFMNLIDNHRSPHLWKRTNSGWQLRHRPYDK
jgi:N-acetyl sugar amidotransferase